MNDFMKYAASNRIGHTLLSQYVNSTMASVNPTIVEERQLNAVAMDVFSRLMMDRIIFLGQPIDDEVSNIVQAQLLYLASIDEKAGISMYINSPGGSVSAGLGIYDTMNLVAPPVSTICTGMAASMGSVLLCAGTKGKRSMLPHSRVMIHQPLGGVHGQAEDILIEAREIEKCREELFHIIAEHSGQPYEKVFADGDRNYWMSAEEALAYGMVDSIMKKK
jgi:ATP-dependent Clp protease protease subunit